MRDQRLSFGTDPELLDTDGDRVGAALPLVDPHDAAAVRWAHAIFGDPDDEESV